MGIKKIGELFGKFNNDELKKAPPHKLAATVDLINEAGLFTVKYGYKYWLGKVKRSGVDYIEMVSVLKEIQGMKEKYNKGGRLTNILTIKAKAKKQENEKQY